MGKTFLTGLNVDAIVTDPTTLNVGIGGAASTYKLDVTGTGRFTQTATFNGVSTGVIAYFNAPTSGGTATFQVGGTSFADIGSELGNFGTGSATNLCVSARSGNDLILGGGALKTLRLSSTGAATFSSSVTASNLALGSVTPSGNGIYFNNPSANGANYAYARTTAVTANTTRLDIGTTYGYNTEVNAISIFNGNVGIGTTSPTAFGAGYTTLGIDGSSGGGVLDLMVGGVRAMTLSVDGGTPTIATKISTQPLSFSTGGSERMRITSGGDLLIGTTTNVGQRLRIDWAGGAGKWGLKMDASDGGAANLIEFLTAGNTRGSITTNGSITSYNITSDYRLKQDFKDYKGLDLLSAIKTYDYEWKSDKSRMYGVIAHELQEVLPYAVTGEKDGEEMQQVDYSKIVPVLVKAIQEQQLQIEELKALIAAK